MKRVIGVIQPLSLDDDFGALSKIANFAPIIAIMDWSGIILGASAFLIIGLFHPIVIKAEYHWGKGCWWLFAVAGLGFCVASLLSQGVISAILGVVGFSCFWSILELFEQEKRVAKGWFPSNPKKK